MDEQGISEIRSIADGLFASTRNWMLQDIDERTYLDFADMRDKLLAIADIARSIENTANARRA